MWKEELVKKLHSEDKELQQLDELRDKYVSDGWDKWFTTIEEKDNYTKD
jgi:hypothetical protein